MNADTKEKTIFYDRDEWKSDQGKVVVVLRYLYGLKLSALKWCNHLVEVLGNYIGYTYSLPNPDV